MEQLQALWVTAGLASALIAAQPLKRRLKRAACANTTTTCKGGRLYV